MPKKPSNPKGSSYKGRSKTVSHNKCAEKRTVLKDKIRAMQGEIDSLKFEHRLVLSQMAQLRPLVETLLDEAGIVLDPFGATLQEDAPED